MWPHAVAELDRPRPVLQHGDDVVDAAVERRADGRHVVLTRLRASASVGSSRATLDVVWSPSARSAGALRSAAAASAGFAAAVNGPRRSASC